MSMPSRCPGRLAKGRWLPGYVDKAAFAGHFATDLPVLQPGRGAGWPNLPQPGRSTVCDSRANKQLALYDKAVIDCSRIR